MYLLGYDVGSSSIKAGLVEAGSGRRVGTATSPEQEMEIASPQPGWAEQNPDTWWNHVVRATRRLLSDTGIDASAVGAIGLSYQMHGLVLVDKKGRPLRPSIIWCDGRAVETGREAFESLGETYCLEHLLNSPGNFTASKLNWVKEHEPDLYRKADKFMVPGDYIAMKMTGTVSTTISGLSEGILWDFPSNSISRKLLEFYSISEDLIPDVQPNMAPHGELTSGAAEELGLPPGTPLTYRAGDQPNNALSLNVMHPGEAAATAGTSGVIYAVTDRPLYDRRSRVNTFVHVNHRTDTPRYGVLLCVNGTGIQYRWLRDELFSGNAYSYEELNRLARSIPVGSEGLTVLPFGNGPERMLENRDPGARIGGIGFNRHRAAHVARAVQEGIAFALGYGMQVMEEMGMQVETIRVGDGNMFRSPVFAEAFTHATGRTVELYSTDGAAGAAIGAGLGAEIYEERQQAFGGLTPVDTLAPDPDLQEPYREAYGRWLDALQQTIGSSGESGV